MPSAAVNPTDLSPVLESSTKSKPFWSLGFVGAREEEGQPALWRMKLYVFKLCTGCFAGIKIAKGTDVANFRCTGGRQTLLSNAVLERVFLGAEPGELCLGARLLLMALYQEDMQTSSLSGPPLLPPAPTAVT